jgi:allantoate deiminase
MPDIPGFAIDPERLQARIDELGLIGQDADGVLFRPVYSDAWVRGRDLVERWMRELGLRVRVDPLGNLFGRLDGSVDGPVVLTGSHIDTVRNGGRYDGALGIHAALSAVAAIRDSGRVPRLPIEVVALCEEEGSRFANTFLGSRAICGQFGADEPETLVDADGISMAEAMSRVGLDPARALEARRDDLAAFVELHIEQGGILEEASRLIGFVETITGLSHLRVVVRGKQNHAGTTPMDLRRDALAGAAQAIVELEALAAGMGRPAVATVGMIGAAPGARNVIPGEVEFSVDLRHADAARLADLNAGLREIAGRVARERGLQIEVEPVDDHPPTPLSDHVRQVIKASAAAEGIDGLDMVSGAGHDSQIFARAVPTGMIFTPSRGGISHSPLEFTPVGQVVPGVTVLARTLWSLASEDGPTG